LSTENILNLQDPWIRLQYVYEGANVKQAINAYAEDKKGELALCGIGWAGHSAGWTDKELLGKNFRGVFCSLKDHNSILKEFGFDKKTLDKDRMCPVPDCSHHEPLQPLLEHLNDFHKFEIPRIGKVIPLIHKNNKPKPTFIDGLFEFVTKTKQLVSTIFPRH